jgi:hypothetical protein
MVRMLVAAVALTACWQAALSAQAPDLRLIGFSGSDLAHGFTRGPVSREESQIVPASPAPPDFVAVAVVSGMFGALGFIGGAFLGAGTGDGEDGNLFAGALLGGWTGGALGATTAGAHPGLALVGSAAGVLIGTAILGEMSTNAAMLAAPLAHGVVTAAIAQMRR